MLWLCDAKKQQQKWRQVDSELLWWDGHLKKMLQLCDKWKKNSRWKQDWQTVNSLRSGRLMNDGLDSQWKKGRQPCWLRWHQSQDGFNEWLLGMLNDSGQWSPGRSGRCWMTLEAIVQWWKMMPCEGKDGKSCHKTDAPVECECALDPIELDASAKECVGETCSSSEWLGKGPKKMPMTTTEETSKMTVALTMQFSQGIDSTVGDWQCPNKAQWQKQCLEEKVGCGDCSKSRKKWSWFWLQIWEEIVAIVSDLSFCCQRYLSFPEVEEPHQFKLSALFGFPPQQLPECCRFWKENSLAHFAVWLTDECSLPTSSILLPFFRSWLQDFFLPPLLFLWGWGTKFDSCLWWWRRVCSPIAIVVRSLFLGFSVGACSLS